MRAVSPALKSEEVEELFSGAVDGGLKGSDDARLRAALAADPELRARFEKYQKAISLLKGTPKEKAPPALASTIMRRVRRRRVWDRRNGAMQQAMYRVPVEIIIPLLLGVMVAALLFFAAP
jgi:anti-sigma factor RsiW